MIPQKITLTDHFSPLLVSPLPDGRRWRLRMNFRFSYLDAEKKISHIVVPANFVTDFASVPRIFWSLFQPWGRYGKAAVVHDYLYACGRNSRKFADEMFLKAMKLLGVTKWRRSIMYWAVRLGGWRAWRQYRDFD